jgi:hypothetical protein
MIRADRLKAELQTSPFFQGVVHCDMNDSFKNSSASSGEPMLKRLCAILIMAIVAGAGGALVGYVAGSAMYEHAWQRAQTNPHLIQGDVGGYLCSAGWLPIQLGVLGTAFGIVIGLGIGIGEAVWTKMKEPESELE